MEEERDNIVTFEDDEGKSFDLEIVDYFNYNGNEYVVLTEPCDCDEHDEACTCGCHDHDHEHGEDCDCGCHEDMDVYVMQVVPVDDENEEFVAIPEEMEEEVLAFADKYLSGELDDMLTEGEDEDEEE